jgi:uncharacterized damage-inducible protein DinB
MSGGIEFAELLDYTAQETQHWKQFFAANPAALDLPIDIADAGTVRGLVKHIFVVELYFALLVSDSPLPNFDGLPVASVDALFQISEDADARYRKLFATATAEDWNARVELKSRRVPGFSKRKGVAQALTHSMRHWAQISTFLRQQGLKQDWNHDFLMSTAMQ